MGRTCWVCIVVMVLGLSACGLRLSGQSSAPSQSGGGNFEDDLGEDLRRDRGEGLGGGVSGTGARARLAEAGELRREGDFRGAVAIYRSLLASTESDEITQETLFELGRSLSDPRNATRDYGEATAHLKQLLEEHPASPFAQRARQRLDAIATLRESARPE